MLSKTPLLHQSFGPSVFLSLSLSLSLALALALALRLILWSVETLCAHCPAWASKTLLRGFASPGKKVSSAGFCVPKN